MSASNQPVDTHPQPGIGLTIRRVAGGARLVGLAWMLTLVLIALARGVLERPIVGWFLVAATLAWGIPMAGRQLGTDPEDPVG